MKKNIFRIVLLFFVCSFTNANADKDQLVDSIGILERPLMERYVLDELKSLRNDNNQLRIELAEKVSNAKLEISDRALRYTADTTNNIFYIITAAASLLVLLGWKSLKDIKINIESATATKITKLIDSYDERLAEVEKSVKNRSDQLIATQVEISNTNKLHSLWMRAGIAKNNEEKILIYDEILESQPEDIEALTYKADALLDEGESKWALSLTNQAIEKDPDYAFALWQRACANCDLGNINEAFDDLKKAIQISPSMTDQLDKEHFLNDLKKDIRYKTLL